MRTTSAHIGISGAMMAVNFLRGRDSSARERYRPCRPSARVRPVPEGWFESSSPLASLHCEDPDRAALRHLRILAGEDQVHPGLHFCGVDAPAGLDGDVLLAVDL